MKKILWVAIAVLMALMVVGCGADPELNHEAHVEREGAHNIHDWVFDNDSGEYIRSMLQFGDTKRDKASVEVEMNFPQYGKAGLAFGFTEGKLTSGAGAETGVYNYYVVGVGQSNDGKLEYYVDYYAGMADKLGGTAEKVGDDRSETVVIATKKSIDDASFTKDKPVIFGIAVAPKTEEGSSALTGYDVTITYPRTGGTKGIISVPIVHANTLAKLTDDVYAENGTNKCEAKGIMLSYGMLTGKLGAGNKVEVKTSWTWDEKVGGSILSADAE